MKSIHKLACLVFGFFYFLGTPIRSFAEPPGYLVLMGMFEDSASVEPGDEFQVKVIRNYAYYEWIGYAKSYKAIIDASRSFFLELPAEESLFYMMLAVSRADGTTVFLNFGQTGELPLLAAAGDSLNLTVRENGYIDFQGKGAEKLRCQQQLHNLGFVPTGGLEALSVLSSPNSFREYYERLLDLTERNLQMKQAILTCYRYRLPENIYHILYYDCIGFQYGRLYRSFYNSQNAKYFNERRAALKELIRKTAATRWVFPKWDNEAVFSAYYTGAIFEKARLELAFAAPGNEVHKDFPFRDYIDLVEKNYIGLLGEALTLYGYVELSKKESIVYAETALDSWPDDPLRSLLKDWISKNKVNTKAYPFELPDKDGKTHRLRDFEGKVMVIDFWFTGCFGCKYMPSALRPVVDRFKGTDEVVFISINVDVKQERWKEGRESGDYTLPEQVELSTYGTGRDGHPLLKYYNINSYPQLLIVDQKGNNVTTSPPDPRIDQGTGLIKLVESLL
ncbi:redoxin domain-containing protein [Olivibacter sp. XZL3]|uniref:TlpA family protein disulfide reductase n=1 Tax=Olivibacter sp. XZL3 TaxID=1735116 RepID=UPI0010666067|nr:redoxin domain-containing protein [Olivibacter sp. XZL3]